MAYTQLADVIVPEVFYPYIVERTKTKSAIFQSGILNADANMSNFLSGGGRTANVPFWKDLSDTSSVIATDDATDKITPQKIAADKDIAIRQVRTQAWSSARLSGLLAGDDPMRRIGDLVADYWTRQFQGILVSTLKGVYLANVSANSGDMVHDIGTDATGDPTADELISADAILDAAQTMGDASDALDTIIMHSRVYTTLAKQNLIDFIPDSEGHVNFPTYLGYRVVKDDGVGTIVGTNRTKYITYLVGRQAICWNEAPTNPSPNIETFRYPDQGNGFGVDSLFTRRQFVLHPYGIKWTDTTIAGEFPTNTELETTANWSRVYPERKQISLAYLLSNG